MLHRTFIFLALVASACDPWGFDDEEATPSTPPSPATPAPHSPAPPEPAVSRTPSAGSGAQGGFAACLLGCDAPGLTHKQRAECRYRCDDVRGPLAEVAAASPAAADIDPVETVVRCMTRCPSSGAEGCLGACKGLIADSPASPSVAVLDDLGGCITDCRRDHSLKPTDRSTCELNCAEVARSAGPGQAGKR